MTKQLPRRQFLSQAAALSALGLASPWATAQGTAWPAVTKIVLPLPAGGGVDVAVRKLAEQMAKAMSSAVIVENKPGAAGLIGAKAVSGAAPDGATVFYIHSGLVTVQAITGRIDILGEFKLVSKVSSSPHVLVVPGNSPYKTLAELLAAMKAQPGKLNYGSGGNGSPTHMMVARLIEKAGDLKATHIPFKGALEAVVAIVGSEIDFCFAPPGSVMEHMKSGKVRALAVSSSARMPQLPNVPSAAEDGVAGYREEPWGGLAVPAKTPDAIVARLAEATRAAAASPEFTELISRVGGTLEVSASPAAFTAQVRAEIEAEKAMVAKLGIKAE